MTVGMLMGDYLAKTGSERIELMDDDLIPRPPRVLEQAEVHHNLYDLLFDWKQKHLYTVYMSGAFADVRYDNRDWVLSCFSPDLMIIKTDRIDIYKRENPDFGRRLLCLIPDIVVEIESSLETEDLRLRRLNHYFRLGVRMVWDIYPRQKTVRVHSLHQPMSHFTHQDVFTNEDVLPEFEMNVGDIFLPL